MPRSAEDSKVSTAIRLLEAWIESDLLFSPLASDLSQGVDKLVPVEGIFRLESKSGGAAVGVLIQFEVDDSGTVTHIKTGDNYSRRLGPDAR